MDRWSAARALALTACLLFTLAWVPPAHADDRCAACHLEQVQGFLQNGMGRSLSRSFQQPSGHFQHEFSDTRFSIESAADGMLQKVERGGFRAEQRVDYVIGSGNAAFGYLVRVGNHLFQSPLSYYTKRGVWDVAPGYEKNPTPEFERPVTAECLWCHSGRPLAIDQTVNAYREPIFAAEAISCDRCHGPTEGHLADPSAATILNPAKLAARARDSVCEQCHLGGEARILNAGRSFGDFRPGMELEEVFSVYLQEQGGAFKVVSHVEQLAASRCAQVSGDAMWCGACHNPHEKPAEPVAYYRQRCQGCHAESSLAAHPEPREDCIGCHMPKRQSFDSSHSAFTDHLIARRPAEPQDGPRAERLKAWRQPAGPLASRNLGLAYARLAEKNHSRFQADEAFRNLVSVMGEFPRDVELPTALGRLILLKDRPQLALELFQHAVELEPRNPLGYAHLADAYRALGSREKAIQALEQAIELDPLLESSYRMLATIYAESSQPELAVKTWDRYLQKVPQSIYARQARQALAKPTPETASTP